MNKTLDIKKDFLKWAMEISMNSDDARKAMIMYAKGMITISELMVVLVDEARNLRWEKGMDIE